MKQTKQNKQTYCQAQSCFNCRSRQCCSFVEAWKMLKGKIVTLCGMSCWNRKVVATFHSFFHLTYITLLWAVQSQGQWRSISTGLSPDRQRGWPLHPLQRSGACSTIIEEGNSAWVDNIPAELVQAGGEDVITTLKQSATTYDRQKNVQPHGPSC